MRVAVIGAGAVGAYYGARLADGGADVTLIARGRAPRGAARASGLTIDHARGTSDRTACRRRDDPAEVGPVDIVLFCVKSYDTEEAAAPPRAAARGRDGRDVAPERHRQRGHDRRGRRPEHVLGGAAYILAAIEEPGVVDAAGPRGSSSASSTAGRRPSGSGPSSRSPSAAGHRRSTPSTTSGSRSGRSTRCSSAFSAMTAATPPADRRHPRLAGGAAMLGAIMTEAWTVGRAIGVPLADDLVERQHAPAARRRPTARRRRSTTTS